MSAAANHLALQRDRDWLHHLCTHRLPALVLASAGETPAPTPAMLDCFPPPEPDVLGSAYDGFLREASLAPWERLLLALAIAPHLEPEFLGRVFDSQLARFAQRAELGLLRSQKGGNAWLPTGQTFVFLYAGYDYGLRLEALELIGRDTRLVSEGLLSLEAAPLSDPAAMGRLVLHPDWLDHLLQPPQQPAKNSLRMTQKFDKIESLPAIQHLIP
jgi:hypothetical protein